MACSRPLAALILSVAVLGPLPAALARVQASADEPTRTLKSDSLPPPSSASQPPKGDKSVSLRPGNMLISRLIGRPVKAKDGAVVGKVSDIVLNMGFDGVSAVIRMGGFLGFGSRDVAVPVSRLSITRDAQAGLSLTVASTAAQLRAAPVFDRTALMR